LKRAFNMPLPTETPNIEEAGRAISAAGATLSMEFLGAER
jgi:hypothetical protein